jgi:ketosteroid isomerase-like protein
LDRSPSIRHLVAAINARDLDAFLAHVTEDIEVESRFSQVGFGAAIYRGRDGVVSWWNEMDEAWDPIEAEVEDSADVGPDRTVILITLHGKGRNSGLRLNDPIGACWYWRGERLRQIEMMDREEAELIVNADARP